MEPTLEFFQTAIAVKLTNPLSCNQASEVYEAGAHGLLGRFLHGSDGTRWVAKTEIRQITLAIANAFGGPLLSRSNTRRKNEPLKN